MNNKEKVLLINELMELQKVEEFKSSLEEQPLTEDVVAMLPAKVRVANQKFLEELRANGQLVKPQPKPLAEYVAASEGYVVLQSTIDQMEKEEHRQLIRAKLLPSDKLDIYPDIDRGSEIIEHYNFKMQTPTGYVDRATGGVDMVRVSFRAMDEFESDSNVGKIRTAQESYRDARAEIDYLLQNIESIANGTQNGQYHTEPVNSFLEV
tara:strand:- start:193 stop:816 length:624 start_codon:yes stop_codon:yes gene_type:complete